MTGKIGQYPSVQRYNRIPTRMKVQLFWGMLATGVVYYQMVKLTLFRITPKRSEHLFITIEESGKPLPEKVVQDAVAQRTMRDTLSIHMTAQMPNPGEMTGAMQYDFDHRRMSLAASHVRKEKRE